MPRRLIRAPDHDRTRSLGWLATWWIETFVVHGPGDVLGQPVRLSNEYTGFVVDCYALDDRGRRLYDSAFLSRPKGTDKSGLAAKLALFEAFGPARFLGWAAGGETYELFGHEYVYRTGEPMGRPVTSPFVRILATEEEQTGNVYATIHHNLSSSDAPLFQYQAFGVQVGLAGVKMPWGGEIRRSTAGAASKDGGIETFVDFDETHLYVTPILKAMYTTVKDNLGKRSKSAEPWFIETTTMYQPGEESAAEATYDLADLIEAGRARRSRLLFDHRWGELPDDQWSDEELLSNAFREAYGDAIEWNPVEGLLNGAYDPRRDVQRTKRLFLNALTESSNAWMELEAWARRGASRLSAAGTPVRPLSPGDVVTLGFDGSSTNDATVLVGCRVDDRHLFVLAVEEVPDSPEKATWEVDRVAIDAAVKEAFKRYTVVGFYADPPLWQDYVDAWATAYGPQLRVHASGKHSIGWWTKRTVQMALALERLHTAVKLGSMSHDDVTQLGKVLDRHVKNARVWKRTGGSVIGKEKKNSPKKIDAAVAAALAFEAAADFAAKKQPDKQSMVPFAVR